MKAWIRVIGDNDAQGELREAYDRAKRARGGLSNIMQVHSLDPKAISLHLDLYLHLMFGKSGLTRLEREMIAVVVSQSNGCQYCVTHHSEALSAHAKDATVVENLSYGRFEGLSSRLVEMLGYASKLTRKPGEVSKDDLDKLRNVGFLDEEILRINLIVSYFNFANRIVSGLGVPLEDKSVRVYKY